jgi:4-amino-4-deoxy-L-arabinose transferase-like glycosyltransferase
LLLGLIFVIALFLRFYRLDVTPKGVLLDESFNGVDILQILSGARPIFLTANNGREALFIYIQALSVFAFGQTDWALRIPSAIIGMLTILSSYLLARRLFDRRVALLTCGWLAVSLWHVMYSRIGLRTIMLPLVCSSAFYCLWRGLDAINPGSAADKDDSVVGRGRSIGWFVAAGLLLGVAQYTYTTARFVPLIVLAFGGFLALTNPALFQRALPGFALTALVALLVFAPEGLYFVKHPDEFTIRATEVSAFNSRINDGNPIAALEYSTLRSLGMFFFWGDDQWDRNIPGRPIFDPLSSVIAVLGLLILARHAREPRCAFTILWFAIMLIPSAITLGNVPNFVRVTGLIPAVYVVPALGAEWLWQWWDRRTGFQLTQLPVACLGIALVVGSLLTYRDYFQYWARHTRVTQTFGSDVWIAIDLARQLAPTKSTPVYVGANDSDQPVPRYDLMGPGRSDGVLLFDGEQTLILPPSGQSATYLFPSRYLPTGTLRRQYFPDGTGQTVAVAPDGETISRYKLSNRLDLFRPEHPVPARFGDDFQLYGFDLPSDVRAGDNLTLHSYWKVLASDSREIYYFAQLLDPAGARRGQDDQRAVVPGYWSPGTRGISTLTFPVDPSLPTGAYPIIAGAYVRSSLERLPVVDGQGKVAGSQVQVALVKVHGSALPPPRITQPQAVTFGDQIGFLGSDTTVEQARAGDVVTLTLDWSARGRPSTNYTVFVHLLDAQNHVVAQADSPPRSGRYPTSLWDAGETIADAHQLTLPPTLPGGTYRYEFGWYTPDNGQRLPVLDPAGHPVRDSVILDQPLVVGGAASAP